MLDIETIILMIKSNDVADKKLAIGVINSNIELLTIQDWRNISKVACYLHTDDFFVLSNSYDNWVTEYGQIRLRF